MMEVGFESKDNALHAKLCLICANPFDTNQRLRCIGKCDHDDVCSICFLRLRSLQDFYSCPSCKQQLSYVICTDSVASSYADFIVKGGNGIIPLLKGPDYIFDQKSQIYFPSKYYKTTIQALFNYKCTICCKPQNYVEPMRQHLQSEHNAHLCTLCIENRQSFPSELRIYNKSEYADHLRIGDQDGSQGHPNCEFCQVRYYDKTKLFEHLSKDHFTCFLCEKQGVQFKYYSDYRHLEDHFRSDHFICEDPICIAQKYKVYLNSLDLTSHQLQAHPFIQLGKIPSLHGSVTFKTKISQAQLKQARKAGLAAPIESREEEGAISSSNDRYEGGMGGRANRGVWQVELQPHAAPTNPNNNGLWTGKHYGYNTSVSHASPTSPDNSHINSPFRGNSNVVDNFAFELSNNLRNRHRDFSQDFPALSNTTMGGEGNAGRGHFSVANFRINSNNNGNHNNDHNLLYDPNNYESFSSDLEIPDVHIGHKKDQFPALMVNSVNKNMSDVISDTKYNVSRKKNGDKYDNKKVQVVSSGWGNALKSMGINENKDICSDEGDDDDGGDDDMELQNIDQENNEKDQINGYKNTNYLNMSPSGSPMSKALSKQNSRSKFNEYMKNDSNKNSRDSNTGGQNGQNGQNGSKKNVLKFLSTVISAGTESDSDSDSDDDFKKQVYNADRFNDDENVENFRNENDGKKNENEKYDKDDMENIEIEKNLNFVKINEIIPREEIEKGEFEEVKTQGKKERKGKIKAKEKTFSTFSPPLPIPDVNIVTAGRTRGPAASFYSESIPSTTVLMPPPSSTTTSMMHFQTDDNRNKIKPNSKNKKKFPRPSDFQNGTCDPPSVSTDAISSISPDNVDSTSTASGTEIFTSWECMSCTYKHTELSQKDFVRCLICDSQRYMDVSTSDWAKKAGGSRKNLEGLKNEGLRVSDSLKHLERECGKGAVPYGDLPTQQELLDQLKGGKAKEGKISGGGREAGNWYCSTCTFCHDQLEQQQFMSCDMCGSERGMVR